MKLKEFYWIQAWAKFNKMEAFSNSKDPLAVIVSDSLEKGRQLELIRVTKPSIVISQDYSDFLNINLFVTPKSKRDELMRKHETEIMELAGLVPSGPSRTQIIATITNGFSMTRIKGNQLLADMIAQYYTENYIAETIAYFCRNNKPVVSLLHSDVTGKKSQVYCKLEELSIGYTAII